MQEDKRDDKIGEYTRVAYYYYKAKLTQEEIAAKMNMSRQRVNRILGKCESLGIVQISVAGIDELYLEMESRLEERYSMHAVRIIENCAPEEININLGSAAARYLNSIIGEGDIIGFSRGRATSALVDSIPEIDMSGIVVTQLVGGRNGPGTIMESDDIVTRFAGKLKASAVKLYAPVIVNNAEIRKSITEEPYFRDAYKTLRSCTIAVAGIGTIEKRIEDRDFFGYLKQGAVGEICTHFFDIRGREIKTAMDERIIAVAIEDFLKIPIRIGVAGGPEKRRAVEGAIRGGYINVLITDPETARNLLKEQ